MKQILKKIHPLNLIQYSLSLLMLLAPAVSFAQLNIPCPPGGINCNSGQSLTGLITLIISWMLALAGLIAVLFLIIGGFWYITSAGNEEQAEKGKGTVINAIIGIIIIILSWVIVNVVSKLVSSNNPTTP